MQIKLTRKLVSVMRKRKVKKEDMKISKMNKSVVVEIICILYILLFVYAATNKILDFVNFQIQLGQSPLLSAFAVSISYSVIIAELLISIFLVVPKFRYWALVASFSLMIMFSVYIFIMLHFSPFVPCSCGGVLEKLSWNQHLVFNILFVGLAIIGIWYSDGVGDNGRHGNKPKKLLWIGVSTATGIITMVVLFLVSEDMMRARNNFTRRFPHHPALFENKVVLDYSAYYFAGLSDKKIYLGNPQFPSTITVLDHNLKNEYQFQIKFPDRSRTYKSLKLIIQDEQFYLYDGSNAFVYYGNVSDGNAKLWSEQQAYFNYFVPIGRDKAVVRTIDAVTNQTVLGVLQPNKEIPLVLRDDILKKQIDGVFDVDGYLTYNQQLRKLIYTYAYRNEYIVADTTLTQLSSGHTIDTTTTANIKVKYVPALKANKIASPGRIVNKRTTTYGDYLFVNSALIGKYEPRDIWNKASVVDVYDLRNHHYVLSFYLYDEEGEKLSDFVVGNGRIFVITGKTISSYTITKESFEKNSTL